MRLRSSLRPCSLALATALITACAATSTATRTPIATTPAASPQVEVPVIKRPDGETAAWWFRHGAAEASRRGSTTAKARSLILFVGDGMSLTTVAAARILAGQRAGQSGEEYRLSWEDFGHTALSRTYNTDLQTPDSAGTMSAMATGVKTRGGVISVDQSMKRGDCTGLAEGARLSLWELAADAGLETGVVTTARLTHATPAATLAHVPDRNWEADIDTPEAARALGCIDIAQQMIANPHGHGPTVLMGGGRVNFMPASQTDPEYPEQKGRRKDGRDLIAQWQQEHPKGSYVWNNAQLAAAPQDAPLLGLFEPSHMQWEHERNASPEGEPSLAQMTRAAIERLRHNDKGFVLLVEGGRIDHGNHRDWPEWMGKIDFSALKLKLLSSIVAISAIQLLKQFMAINTVSDRDIMWLVIVHVVFVVSSVLLALSDRIAVHSDHGHGKNGGGDGGSHAKSTASDDTGHAEPASQATQSAPLSGTRTAGIAPQSKAAPATAIKVTRVKIQRTGNHIEAGREHSDFDGACAADDDLLQEAHRSSTIKRRLH